MTIALAINVGDSLVFASDSATTQMVTTPTGELEPVNIWNSANKIFNLRKGLPVGAMTWGLATVGNRSIGTMAKDLRQRFAGQSSDHLDWELDPKSYTIKDAADSVRHYFYDDLADPKPTRGIGLLVGGYSAGSDQAEWYTLKVGDSAGLGGPLGGVRLPGLGIVREVLRDDVEGVAVPSTGAGNVRAGGGRAGAVDVVRGVAGAALGAVAGDGVAQRQVLAGAIRCWPPIPPQAVGVPRSPSPGPRPS